VTPNSPLNLDSDPLWYKDAILYEVHARAFYDSDDDGMGDFRGLSAKLDYLRDLGVTALWLLPFFPSPWRDDGYDISDYKDIHPAYGTLRDFQVLLKRAHSRGIRVLTEIVLNHTSDQHPWFQHSRNAPPGTRWRDFYVWSDTAEKYKDARIIFQDFETSNWSWDPVAKAYYWHRFYSHQPDLNFDNAQVQRAILDVIDFWCDMGVDGFRLDAVPYLYEREGTSCENLPETHQFIRKLREHIDSKYKDRVLIAEANQWPEDAVAYFGAGDECHMAFHFPLMTRLFMAIRMEDRFPIMEILQETPAIASSSQWALFLRNHDELTLEMVTDEERDYMYRVYGRDRRMRLNLGIRRRLAPLLENDRRKIELMNALLFSLPGTPVIYYGDEIGMGDNIYLGDRNGVRTPMQWSADRNAGFSRANPQKLYLPIIIDPEYHYEAINVESQLNNPHSLLWWMKHLVEQRKRFKAFGRGTLEFLRPSNRKVLAFYRRYQDETILVVVNLSRFPQHVELDLSEFKGNTPMEIFGRTDFPPIGDQFYDLTLGALGFYWFSLEARQAHQESVAAGAMPGLLPLIIVEDWEHVFEGRSLATLLRRLPAFLKTRRWFQGQNRSIRSINFADDIPIPDTSAHLLLGSIEYNDGDPETYILPGSVAIGESSEQIKSKLSDVSVAELQAQDASKGVLYSAVWDPSFCQALLGAIARRRRFRGLAGELVGTHTRDLRRIWGSTHPELGPAVLNSEQTNTAIAYGRRFLLKLYRKVEPGIHPEPEMGTFLTERDFQHAAPVAGLIEYRAGDGDPTVVATLFAFIENQGDAWHYTLDSLSQFFETGLARRDLDYAGAELNHHPLDQRTAEIPRQVHELIGAYVDSARLMGQRTAELHLALSDTTDPAFSPELFTDHYRAALQHSLVALSNQTFQFLRFQLKNLSQATQAEAQKLLDEQDKFRRYFRAISDRRVSAVRIRIHDDLRLSRLLHTGKDFVFIGFEGRSGRPLSERRIKRSALRDVAGLMMSFQYAADAVFYDQVPGVKSRPEIEPALQSLASYWLHWTSAAFLNGYFERIGEHSVLAADELHVRLLLDAFLLEHSLEEVREKLGVEPERVRTPLKMLQRVLAADTA
jgi:maltose alpha-D-glucosyltransferase/alpha-amylase